MHLTPALSQMLVPRGRGSGFILPELSPINRREGKFLLRISAHAGSLRLEMGFANPDMGFNPVCEMSFAIPDMNKSGAAHGLRDIRYSI